MNDNRNEIWKQLQQHSMQPPDDIFEKAWEHILQYELQSKDRGEWNAHVLTEVEIKERKLFSNLQQYSVTPPAQPWTSILTVEKKSLSPKKQLLYLSSFGKSAAILLLAGGAAFLGIYFTRNNENRTGTENATIVKVPQINVSTTTPVAIASHDTSSAHNQIEIPIQQKNTSKLHSKVNKKKALPSATNGGPAYYDNDFLLTLINYKDAELQQFVTKLVSKKKITLSRYSYISLSDKMAQLIKDLCSVKRNGKPDKKAKKTKRRFEKWKKADEKYFDKGPRKNPADIIDLSDFIMKK